MTDLDLTSAALLQKAASLLLYQSILEAEPIALFLKLRQTIAALQTDKSGSDKSGSDKSGSHKSDKAGTGKTATLQAYGQWFSAMATVNQSWQSFIVQQILRAENPFTQQVQTIDLSAMPIALVEAVRHDLRALQQLYLCRSEELAQIVQQQTGLGNTPIVWQLETGLEAEIDQDDRTSDLMAKFAKTSDWADLLEPLAAYYRECGTGIFAAYRAFRWQEGQLCGIAYPDTIRLHELVGYETQKEALLKNTQALLKGYSALHVLLYGSRGSGKSSLVKSLLHEYGQQGLRLIEVPKADLRDLPAIVDKLRQVSLKFIIFVDDLSFEEDDDAYKALKVVLEGNLTARPQNVIVYATSNRRHLIREYFADRPRPKDSDEVHAWDTMQEKLSFSDRFGLTLTFNPADQDTYLEIVRHLAAGLAIEPQDLEFRALQWATRHNGRSGRTARQFVDFLRADLTES